MTKLMTEALQIGGRSISKNKQLGFTMIEVMVVVAVIAFFLSIAVVSYSKASQSSRDNRRKGDLEQIRAAIEMYRTDCGQYPSGPIAFGTGSIGSSCTPVSQIYMPIVPQDPLKNSQNYTYYYNQTGGNSYILCARLEGATSGTCTGSPYCGSGECNYQLSQP